MLEVLQAGLLLVALGALLGVVAQGLEGVEVGVFEVVAVVGLELDEGVDVGPDLCDHEVEFLHVF